MTHHHQLLPTTQQLVNTSVVHIVTLLSPVVGPIRCSIQLTLALFDHQFDFPDASGQVKELVLPKALDLDRPKRARTTFSPDQLFQLEAEFNRNQYLVGRERTQLAHKLGLSETQVGSRDLLFPSLSQQNS